MNEQPEAHRAGRSIPGGGHTPLNATNATSQNLVGLVVVREYALWMVLGGRDRWRAAGGYSFVPLEVPGGVCPSGSLPASLVPSLSRRWLGREAQAVSCTASYGPSAKHRIDRLTMAEHPLPLLYVERLAPATDTPDEGVGSPLGRILLRSYLARASGEPSPPSDPSQVAALLLLPLGALRAAVRGMPLADLLLYPGVECATADGADVPENALVYITGEYGERHLLRAVAKYGPEVLEGHALREG